MKKYDFTQTGGMPVTQEIFAGMQGYTEELADVLKAMFGNNNLILSGVVDTNGTLSNGFVVIAGEVLKFVGSTTSTHIAIQESTSQLVYADGTSKAVVTERVAVPGTSGTLLTAFTRLSDYKVIQDKTSKINPGVSTYSDSQYRLTIGESINGVAHLDGWFKPIAEDINAATPLVITLLDCDFPDQYFYVSAQLQHVTTKEISHVIVEISARGSEFSFNESGVWPSDLENYNLFIPIHTSIEY